MTYAAIILLDSDDKDKVQFQNIVLIDATIKK